MELDQNDFSEDLFMKKHNGNINVWSNIFKPFISYKVLDILNFP